MKTQWSQQYVMRTARPHQWRRAKQAELEARTGVPWTVDMAYGKVRFAPSFKARDAGQNHNDDDQGAVMGILNERSWPYHICFMGLAAMLGWPLGKLFDTLNTLRWPVAPRVTFSVNRKGDAVAVRAL